MPRIWISIGSNLDAEVHVHAAILALSEGFGAATLSTVYRTRAVGFDGPPFLNLVAGFETGIPVEEVLRSLAAIEDRIGRVRGPERFVSRAIDLDLLTYGDQRLTINGKKLPRAEILEYAFVLRPLAEVAPDERHPETGLTYTELWEDFAGDRSGMEAVKLEPGKADP